MQRKFLEDLGLEKESIDAIMAENGSDIERLKQKYESERDNYKEQLETAQNALKDFEGVDIKDLQGKIETLQADLATKESDYQTKLTEMEFQSLLDGAITKSGAKSKRATKALLDIEALKASKNQSEDLAAALEKLKTEKEFLFASNEPFRNAVGPTGAEGALGLTKETFAKMGYGERLKLKQSDPIKYAELKGE